MVRKHFLMRNDQYRALNKLPGKISEHLRIAIDDYILKKKKEEINVSESKSWKKSIYFVEVVVKQGFTHLMK